MKRATVIITTYKRPRFLVRAIESVLAQTYPEIEVVIVDDNGKGSPDQLNTVTALGKYLDKTNLIYHISPVNGGACEARNTGVRVSSGDYLFFLDDDDIFMPEKVAEQVASLESHPAADGALCAFRRLDENNAEITAESNFPVAGNFTHFAVHGNFYTPMLCIRRPAFERSGGFRDIPRFQDRFFMLHCLGQQMKFITTRSQLYTMYEHAGERITYLNTGKTMQALDTLRSFIRKSKSLFTPKEWNQYLEKDYKMRALCLYQSNYRNRLSSVSYWIKCFRFSRDRSYLLFILKSLVPVLH